MIRRTKKLSLAKGPSKAAIPVIDLYPISMKVSGGLGKQGMTGGVTMPAGGQPAYF